jgi:hypothetical protein
VAAYQLAQINVARLRGPIDSPLVAEFVEALEPVNQFADASPGFVGRFKTEAWPTTCIDPITRRSCAGAASGSSGSPT